MAPESKTLYLFMKFGEKEVLGSMEDLKPTFNEIVLKLNGKISNLNEREGMDFVLISMRNLTNYTSILYERLISYQQSPIEICAMFSRNLFECYLLVAFILSDPSKAKEFIGQKASDELQINESFVSISKPGAQDAAIEAIQDRMSSVKELMRKHEIPIGKHWAVSFLAKQTNNEDEYDAFFKLYSKYVHPSSWLVNSFSDEYGNPVFRNIFLLQGQHYASCTLKLVSEYLHD